MSSMGRSLCITMGSGDRSSHTSRVPGELRNAFHNAQWSRRDVTVPRFPAPADEVVTVVLLSRQKQIVDVPDPLAMRL